MNHNHDTDPITGYPTRDQEPDQKAGNQVAQATKPTRKFFNQRTCGYCGQDFGQEVTIAICDACDRQIEADKEKAKEEARQQRVRARMVHWSNLAGKFSTAAPTKLPGTCMQDLLERWRPGLKFGATITGDGLGKSWLLWLLLKKAYAAGREFEARIATEMRGEIMALARNGDSTPSLRKLTGVPILAIDDFGLCTPTPAADELWAKILEVRAAAGRPTLIVSPYDGGSLIDRFSDRTAGNKILKLLGTSHGWVLDTRKQQLHPPTGR